MPDLGGTTLLNSETLTLTRYPNSLFKLAHLPNNPFNSSDEFYPCPIKTLISDNCPGTGPECPVYGGASVPKTGLQKTRVTTKKVLDDYVSDWTERKIGFAVSGNRSFLPFLVGDRGLDIFGRLPLPYVEEEFKLESTVKDGPNDKMEPPPYVHIRRNIYLVKKKRDDNSVDIGCSSCSSTSTCFQDCLCKVQSISCSRACPCAEACTNRPFRKEKKIKIVKTSVCGWGVEAAESINKGDFVIEYVGEVIDDVECTQRLWAMKNEDMKNFYMCEIRKDFTIDATFKGNASRFLNHSCDSNCKMEKWQVEKEIRVGVFACRSIEVGEPLTCDYRFVRFGAEVKCLCGAANCQGYLGAKRKINLVALDSRRMHLAGLSWGSKRKRAFPTQVQHLQ